ncbi:helix-turn-helix transcriptional regulator [Companilactobacillus ginsenosidimutans]|uniref:helix-turn-helix transcriptional regulator n=1 Tax=Companilactobacillus ginsenosidimutans TaxID=1007676 RepID=UPI000660C995|nr:helix-turn-helix transcriptional regulator [Companilactobacillus ginsenosidimutans]
MHIGKNISQLRQNNHWSQDDLADKLKVSRQTISNWETGRTYPDITSLTMLSDIFEISLDDLIKEDIPLMKNKIKQTQICWLGFGIIGIMILTYACLLVLKWSVPIGSLLVGATTVFGLYIIFKFMKVTNTANLKTFKQVISYVAGKPIESAKQSKSKVIVQSIIGAIIGLGIGAVLVWLIFHFVLHVL